MKKLYSLFAAVVMAVAVNAQTVLLNETFDNLSGIGGNDGVWNGNNTGTGPLSDYPTWTFENSGGASQCIKAGSSSKKGVVQSPAISGYEGDVVLTFRAGAWDGNGEKLVLNVSVSGGASVDVSSVTLVKGSFSEYTVNITGFTDGAKVKFEAGDASKSRFFIDDIKVVAEDIPPATPALTVDQDALEFPQTLVGSTSEAQTLTVTGENLDAVPTYELSGADASEFSVSGSLTAEGGALSLTFHPATSGTKTATLTVTSGSLSQMVTLSGEGKALPVLTVDTDSMVFPETVVGETSDEETLEVNWANLSDLPAFEITGEDADAFEVANAVLKEDETGGYIHIVFKPSSTGIKTAVLTLTADGITKTVALSGTGVEDSSLSVGDTHAVKTGLVKNTLVDNVLVFTAKSEVNIYNFSGQTVKTASVSENTAVDVTGLPKGVYIVTGVVNGKNISQRIIKK